VNLRNFGETTFPGASRSLAHPIIAGPPATPRHGLTPNSSSGSLRVRRSVFRFTHGDILVDAKRSRLDSRALTPPRAKHYAQPRVFSPGTGAAAGSRARHRPPALPPFSPTPFLRSLRATSAPRSHLHVARFARVKIDDSSAGFARPGLRAAQSPRVVRLLALCAPLAHS
jgi:hypothetical protein